MQDDEKYMMRALELARQGEGLTRPNPPVGAVLVRDGKVLAEGWHRKAGEDHAERDCFGKVPATENLQKATLYVTLEPCSTHGRTPPCTELILERRVGRVVVAVEDCNPSHAGRGLDLLRQSGVEVTVGVCRDEASELIAPFEKWMTTRRPFVTLKLALTLDGKIADRNGDSKWITGAGAREKVQALRRRVDAIMVGAGTVRADNPSLLPRPAEGRAPYRVVMGKNIPADSVVLTDDAAERTLLFEGDVDGTLEALAERGIMHVLCEGGGQLAAALMDAGAVDEYLFFVAPKVMGVEGIDGIARTGALMESLYPLRFTSVELVGDDIMIKAKEEK